jgi:hypothetical protein
LEASALDAGLPPKDVRRQIECGLAAGVTPMAQTASESTPIGAASSQLMKPPEAGAIELAGSDGLTCGGPIGATESTAAIDLRSALAALWQSTATKGFKATDAGRKPSSLDGHDLPAELPMLPPPLVPLPPLAVGTGSLDKPCQCGSTEFVELAISDDRTRRDCRECGRFVAWGRWYKENQSE